MQDSWRTSYQRREKLLEFETVALINEINIRIQDELPSKLKDPESFILPISIEKHVPLMIYVIQVVALT